MASAALVVAMLLFSNCSSGSSLIVLILFDVSDRINALVVMDDDEDNGVDVASTAPCCC